MVALVGGCVDDGEPEATVDSGADQGSLTLDLTPDRAVDLAPDALSEPADEPAAPFAVVELFGSEGCSSCPPAETVFASLVKSARAANQRIFPLGWHVDYWNYLGWTDRFSSKAATDRQKAYAKVFKASTVYTPQLLINGTSEARPAYSATVVTGAVAMAMGQSVTTSLTLWRDAGSGSSTEIVINHKVKDAPSGSKLVLVLVQRELVSSPTAGENKGKTLHHENSARSFITVPAARGRAALKVPSDLVRKNASVIGFVQDPATMKILGATQLDLGS